MATKSVRTVRYLLQFPIWGDEAMLGHNFLELDYASLLRKLHETLEQLSDTVGAVPLLLPIPAYADARR